MKCIRSYYSSSLQDFLRQDSAAILGRLVSNYQMAQLSEMMEYSWEEEIPILKEQLKGFSERHIIFEYVIPRMGETRGCYFRLGGGYAPEPIRARKGA